jgi:hypothetical protein
MNHDLQALIKATIVKYPHAGPEELAMYVVQATPAGDVKAFYAHLLIGVCRTTINVHRSGSKHGPRPQPKPTQSPRPSPKLEERRTWWAEMLTVEMVLADKSRKVLGDCTTDDLQYCIKDREQYIEFLDNQIYNLQQIVELMGRHRVATVRELPEQQQWGRAS